MDDDDDDDDYDEEEDEVSRCVVGTFQRIIYILTTVENKYSSCYQIMTWFTVLFSSIMFTSFDM
jgi:hypothetical protein